MQTTAERRICSACGQIVNRVQEDAGHEGKLYGDMGCWERDLKQGSDEYLRITS